MRLCLCRNSNNVGPIVDPGVGGQHYRYCPAYAMTEDEELVWRTTMIQLAPWPDDLEAAVSEPPTGGSTAAG